MGGKTRRCNNLLIQNINLPFNFPNIKNFEGFFFNRITDNHETELTMQLPVKGVNYYSENIEYWNVNIH